MYYKNWKTIRNVNDYNTESTNPILKKDEHHSEIIDITDGLVVDEPLLINPENELLQHSEILKQDSVLDAFSKVERPKKYNLNDHYIF